MSDDSVMKKQSLVHLVQFHLKYQHNLNILKKKLNYTWNAHAIKAFCDKQMYIITPLTSEENKWKVYSN